MPTWLLFDGVEVTLPKDREAFEIVSPGGVAVVPLTHLDLLIKTLEAVRRFRAGPPFPGKVSEEQADAL